YRWRSRACRPRCRDRGSDRDAELQGPRPTSPCRDCVLLGSGDCIPDDGRSRRRTLASRQRPLFARCARDGQRHHRACRSSRTLATLGASTYLDDGTLVRLHADRFLRRQWSSSSTLEPSSAACLLVVAEFGGGASHCTGAAPTFGAVSVTAFR